MRLTTIFILFMLFLSSTVSAEWFHTAETLKAKIIITTEYDLKKDNPDASVEYIEIAMSHYPFDSSNQFVDSISSEQEYIEKDGDLVYNIDDPPFGKQSITLESEITIKNTPFKVNGKVPFPLNIDDPELLKYTEPTEYIDSDKKRINILASDLVKGIDDEYEAVFKISNWLYENIDYELTLSTEGMLQKASWVLDERYGACDELTNLFVALLRSIGIPGRYISGTAYTNLDDIDEWGAHAWAEVYFPGYGWIPFDLSYGEFGWVDATHIKFQESLDSGEHSVKFRWLGTSSSLETNVQDIKTTLISVEDSIPESYTLEISPIKENVGFNSYNLIEVKVKNLVDYNQIIRISLTKVLNVENIGQNALYVFLKPNEEKNVYFTIRLTDYFKKNYIYTIPAEVSSIFNRTSKSSFVVDENYPVYTISDIIELRADLEEEERKSYSREVDFTCSTKREDDTFYSFEEISLDCTIRNKGNDLLKDIEICYDEDCRNIDDLGISKSKELTFDIDDFEIGFNEVVINAKNRYISKKISKEIHILDRPDAEIIINLTGNTFEYHEMIDIPVFIEKKSLTHPLDLSLTINAGVHTEVYQLSKLVADYNLDIKIDPKHLTKKKDKINMELTYYDDEGKEYNKEYNIDVNLENTSFSNNVRLYINRMEVWLRNLFS